MKAQASETSKKHVQEGRALTSQFQVCPQPPTSALTAVWEVSPLRPSAPDKVTSLPVGKKRNSSHSANFTLLLLTPRNEKQGSETWPAQIWSFERWGNVDSPSIAATRGTWAEAEGRRVPALRFSLCLVWMYSKYKLNSNENFRNVILPKCACVCFGGGG